MKNTRCEQADTVTNKLGGVDIVPGGADMQGYKPMAASFTIENHTDVDITEFTSNKVILAGNYVSFDSPTGGCYDQPLKFGAPGYTTGYIRIISPSIAAAGTLSPSGAAGNATAANQVLQLAQETITATQTTQINTKTPALGQTNMAGSSPVVISSNQSAIPVTEADGASVTLGALADAQATNATGSWSVVSLLKGLWTQIGLVITALSSSGQIHSDLFTYIQTGGTLSTNRNLDLLRKAAYQWVGIGFTGAVAKTLVTAGTPSLGIVHITSIADGTAVLNIYDAATTGGAVTPKYIFDLTQVGQYQYNIALTAGLVYEVVFGTATIVSADFTYLP